MSISNQVDSAGIERRELLVPVDAKGDGWLDMGGYMSTHRDAVPELGLKNLLARLRCIIENIGLPVLVNSWEGLVHIPLGELELGLKVDAECRLALQLTVELEVGADCDDAWDRESRTRGISAEHEHITSVKVSRDSSVDDELGVDVTAGAVVEVRVGDVDAIRAAKLADQGEPVVDVGLDRHLSVDLELAVQIGTCNLLVDDTENKVLFVGVMELHLICDAREDGLQPVEGRLTKPTLVNTTLGQGSFLQVFAPLFFA